MNNFSQLDETIKAAQKIILLTKKDKSNEELLCLASFYNLIDKVYNKESVVLIPEDLTHDQQTILIQSNFPLEKVISQLEGYSYTIKIPKSHRENIKNVVYDETDEYFEFSIQTNTDDFDTANIQIEKMAPDIDLAIFFNIGSIDELGDMDYKEMFKKDKIVSISTSDIKVDENLASINIKDDIVSLMQLIVRFAKHLSFEPDPTDAQTMLNGLTIKELDSNFENANEGLLLDMASTLKWGANMKTSRSVFSSFAQEKKENKQPKNSLPPFPSYKPSAFPPNRPSFNKTNSQQNSGNLFDPSSND